MILGGRGKSVYKVEMDVFKVEIFGGVHFYRLFVKLVRAWHKKVTAGGDWAVPIPSLNFWGFDDAFVKTAMCRGRGHWG
jgi:hypothetical protein